MISISMLALLPLFSVLDAAYAQINVTTNLGIIQGLENTIGGNTFQEFRGIPYAEPPVGNLRFALPQPKAPWMEDGILEAMEFGPSCPQGTDNDTMNISEDCLTLNIIVPPGASEANPFPVMIFIPDRGFGVFAAGSEYTGREMASSGSVIVVTINYRFLTFGYFSTGDDCLPGNYGLWDQRLAIEWVRDNIRPFGGDPTMITLVGQGREGATAVSSQILSPLNDNQLFQRAIIQSSLFTDVSYIMTKDEAQRLSDNLADILNCNQTSWLEKIACLRNRTWEEIVSARVSGELLGYFEPRVDGHFFPESLDRLLEGDHIYQYDIMAGVNSDEGSLFMNGYASIDDVFRTVEDVTRFIEIQFNLRYEDEEKAQRAIDAVEQQYIDPVNGLTDRDSALRYLFDLWGDGYYVSNMVNFLRRHQIGNDSNTYMYFFNYVDDSYLLLPDEPRDRTRAVQGEELFYLWDTFVGRDTAQNAPASSRSADIRSNLIRYWTNFVKTGNPNEGNVPDVLWPAFDSGTESYLWITDSFATGQNLRAEETRFWLNYIPDLTKPSNSEICSLEAPVPDIMSGVPDEPLGFVTLNISSTDGTPLGQVRGIVRKMDEGVGGLDVRVFRGIPYTSPPLDERRFAYSEVLEDWGENTFFDATMFTPGCPQRPGGVLSTARLSEDCLHLNIFTPDLPDAYPMPVIVYIHFGQYRSGNGVAFAGATLAAYARAVVVSFNYRLGALGFLSTGDSSAPGNYGIMDAVTALKWINRYIGSFGGNPENVTALGMGSGAQIAHLISINGLNEGLMHKIIALGDSVISPAILTSAARDPLQYAMRLAEVLDCPTTTTREIVDCLRSRDANDIALTDVGGSNIFFDSFTPVWDGGYLKDSPDNILASGDYETIPLLLGSTENDNTIVTAIYPNAPPSRCPDEQFAGSIIDDVVDIFYGGNEEIASIFRMFYLESELSPTVPNEECMAGQQVSEFLSDLWLNAPFLETGRIMSEFGKEMYLYSLTYHPEYHVYEAVLPSWVDISFGDDIQFAFGWPYDRLVAESDGICHDNLDRKVAINFMNMITTFAKTGVPSANPTDPFFQWLPYNTSLYNALFLDVCPTQQPIPRAREKDTLWNSVIAGLQDSQLNPEQPSVTPAAPEPCVVDGFLGLGLSTEQAGQVIGALIIVLAGIAGLVLLGVLLKVCTTVSRKANKPV